ncbi:MAG TPA: TonB-dependent receptor [Gemmatimonadaceae bacterium]
MLVAVAGRRLPAQDTVTTVPPATSLAKVTIIGSRTDLDEARARIREIPGGTAVVAGPEIRATRQANLKDALKFTPGVFVQPRLGAADESQISIRGSGLRNNFHARGVNLLVNGMPYRNADGFTDFESLELLTTESIEVYKGANALAFGGSTMGGAINLDTKTGYTAPRAGLFLQGGSFDFLKGQLETGARFGAFDTYASYAHTTLNGFREWSEQRRDRVNVHAGARLGEAADVRGFYLFAHVREHLPGALDSATFAARPTSADPENLRNRWGRDYDLHHLGFQLRAQLTPTQRIEVSPYLQYRDIDHPIFQVIAQISHDYGAEVRYQNSSPLGGLDNRFTFGIQPAYETMRNRQFVNVLGKHGDLTKNQHDEVTMLGAYVEDVLGLTPELSAIAGARFETSTRKTTDHFLSNADQSDSRTFRPFTPRVGLLYRPARLDGEIFANASRTFEPPLLLELNSLTIPGFVDVKGQRATQYEIGARSRHATASWELSLFDIELRNEILNVNVRPFPGAPFTVPTYRNSPQTRHSGVEAAMSYQFPGAVFVGGDVRDHVALRGAYTYSRFRFVEDSTYSGNDIPGAPTHHLLGEIKYVHPSGFSIAQTNEWVPQSYFVNSANTTKNRGWYSAGLRAEWAVQPRGLTAFAAVDNLTNGRFSQSVQVDNAAGKYFEPADRRAFYAGLRWAK